MELQKTTWLFFSRSNKRYRVKNFYNKSFMSSLSFYHHILFHTFIREKRILFFRIIFFYLQLTGFQLFQSRKCTLQVADYYIAVWILLKIEKRLIWTFQNISRLTARCESFQAWLVLSKIVRYSINPKRSNKR